MGVSISWLAVRGKPAESVTDEFGLRRTGESGDFPLDAFVGAPLAGGWYLIVARGCDHAIVSDPALQRMSGDCEAVACSIEEHVMWSSAVAWSHGRKLWSVTHNGGDIGTDDLTAQGDLPDIYPSIRDRLLAEQRAADDEGIVVDYVFDIPLDLAQAIAGFNHQSEFEGSFEVLAETRTHPAPKPWWKFWVR